MRRPVALLVVAAALLAVPASPAQQKQQGPTPEQLAVSAQERASQLAGDLVVLRQVVSDLQARVQLQARLMTRLRDQLIEIIEAEGAEREAAIEEAKQLVGHQEPEG